ncbi:MULTISPECIES: DUF5701 family protein [unclassified Actinotalea]|uniref:DUF5701 family protein n=1 Tax=unclassified Actinotalea TaxID=2638618 RepID=UPI0015F69350|nr:MULTISPECIES: DUF5701 family protein [unclassified Actinotalea]
MDSSSTSTTTTTDAAAATATTAARAEFDRQAATLLAAARETAGAATHERLRELVARLRPLAAAQPWEGVDPASGRVPFLLVASRELLPVDVMMRRATLAGRSRPGFVDRSFEPGSLRTFVPPPGTVVPDAQAYLLLDVERGEEFCGVVPSTAMDVVAQRGRTLLTIEEGVGLLTHHPGVLVKNRCFSLGGSRCGDRRVPALWISQGAPKLGWCWEGNPHTWLGLASAGSRVAA